MLDVEEIERYANITGVERPINTDIAFEAKTANAFTADLWGPSQELEIRQNNLRTEHVIPLYYETQIQWYCGILKLKGMYLAVLIGGSDFGCTGSMLAGCVSSDQRKVFPLLERKRSEEDPA